MRFVVIVAGALGVLVACSSDDPPTGSSGASGSSSSSSSSSSSGAGSSSGTPFSSEQHAGVATYYDADGSGNCGFDKSPNDLDVAAFDSANYAKSAACGECVHVQGPKGALTIRVVDSCPDCDANHLDLSKSAFAKIADVSAGRVPITFQTVACDVTGNLEYVLKDGSSIYWTAIQIRNHKLPITKVEYEKAGSYVEMKREDYNYFVDASGVGTQPAGLKVRVTAADGQTVEDTLPGDAKPGTVAGTSQFK